MDMLMGWKLKLPRGYQCCMTGSFHRGPTQRGAVNRGNNKRLVS